MARFLIPFAAVITTALALVPAGAHVLELYRKLGLGHDDYLLVQTLYLGWAFLGVLIFAALGLNLAQGWIAPPRSAARRFALAAVVLIGVSLVIFFAFTFPVNQQTRNWSEAGVNWQALRARWEWSHAANALVSFAALGCSTLAALLRR